MKQMIKSLNFIPEIRWHANLNVSPLFYTFFFPFSIWLSTKPNKKKSNRVTTAITITHGTQHMGRSGSCYPYCSTAVAVRVAAATTKKKTTARIAAWSPVHRRW